MQRGYFYNKKDMESSTFLENVGIEVNSFLMVMDFLRCDYWELEGVVRCLNSEDGSQFYDRFMNTP